MTRCDAAQDVFQRPCHARETSRRGYLAWPHAHAGTMGATARPGTPPRTPAPPLAASRASPRGHAAWHLFSARTPTCWKPPRGCTTSATPPGLASTGLHQLDGARYLRDAQHADAMLGRLVAHHSCAIIEAGERGLAGILSSESDPAPDALSSVLTCCDMTTSPDGQPVPVDRRLAEIHDRYGPGHLVSRSISAPRR
jgi:hypothetical protein